MNAPIQNQIAVLVDANPTLVLVDEEKFEEFFEHVRKEAATLEVDLTTDKGRKAIASMAYKIVRSKTAIDEAGKKLNEDARAQINAVDAARKKMRDRFDALRDEVRKPLSDWEDAEANRKHSVDSYFAFLKDALRITIDDTSDMIQARHETVTAVYPKADVFQDRFDEATDEREQALITLSDALARIKREEAEREELAMLRQMKADREAADEAARLEAERVAREAEEEERKAAATKAEILRVAAERERMELEAKQKAEAEAAEKIAAAERSAKQAEEDAKRQIEAERQAIENAKAAQAKKDEEERKAEEARQKNKAHRAKVMGAAKVAIIGLGASEAVAVEIVKAIVAGNVPHVSIQF